MRLFAAYRILLIVVLAASCGPSTHAINEPEIETAIRGVLDEQVRAWNEGDIQKFLVGYARSESLRFASGGEVHRGWDALLQRYNRTYPDQAAMGRLTFSELDVTVLAKDAGLVFGKWQLDRENDVPYGYFTLLFSNTKDGWKIVHDHTSSADTK
jgi:ketosteroid isomerase-like protein